MAHAHHHHHHERSGRNLLISILLNIGITLAQVIGGIISGSLALLSDALHNFSDVLSLIISYLANRFTKKQASSKRTFGYKRAEIMAAFVNSATLIVIALFLIKEAVERFFQPEPIAPSLVIWLSALGIAANGLSVLLIRKDADNNMNMKSAYLHLLTDMMASVAVLLGGLLMYFYQLYWIDPALTIAIGLYLIYMGYDLLKSSTKVLMLFTPDSIEVEGMVEEISRHRAIKNVHHVHLWQLNEHEIHLEAHIDFHENISIREFDAILKDIEVRVHHEYGITHVSIQPECGRCHSSQVIVQD
ncbi:cobalt-zinc-cadmium efflux system protein [Muriicola jejuensis]|uniref:Cation diffusion facilitator family transporter n=1 Tax=Muriicola jejuensis TaxID=504488 RepID=A0A6P0U9N3_9FLAO|nr:cation diffusion facilitator family transporter [Muriicola jejuensis]NER09945.1 cation diffusion facilitator family transporter [Muriicola jejuensis]SMP04507.1 cobalt-zinc-cadmium efflux system protein [Muriicola jejuensis]